MSDFPSRFCNGSLMKVHYPKLYNMAQLFTFNVLLISKDLTIIFYSFDLKTIQIMTVSKFNVYFRHV